MGRSQKRAMPNGSAEGAIDRSERFQLQTETARLLKAISRSPRDLPAVLEMVVGAAARACGAEVAGICAPELEVRISLRDDGSDPVEITREFWTELVLRVRSEAATVRSAVGVAQRETASCNPSPGPQVWDLIGIPLLSERGVLGALVVGRRSTGPFSDDEAELLTTFADQASIAIEMARLSEEAEKRSLELSEALRQQAATADVLKIISRSTVDVQTVLQTLVETAAELCDADMVSITRPSADGNAHYHVASLGFTPAWFRYMQTYPLVPGRGTLVGRTLLERKPVQIPDVLADPEYVAFKAQKLSGMRTMLGVPLMREQELLGVFLIARRTPRPFSERQTELVTTFAAQAVIAIENARMFDEIQDKGRQLEIANKYKSNFIASASHDLRQPLHALNLFVAQLHAESDEQERRRLVTRIDAAVSAMNELFESLLDMSKLEAGILTPHIETFSIDRLFKRIETTFADAATERGLRLRLVSSSACIRSDFVLLERILLNLVSNAVHHAGKGKVLMGCRRVGDRLRIDICDTGPGIPQAQQGSIFAEFYRLPATELQGTGGFGLGLAIVERLSKLLGHAIEVASTPGRGSRFSVLVPRTTITDSIVEANDRAFNFPDPATGKLVVVIDDDALALEGVAGMLKSWGCRVIPAVSPGAARAELERQSQSPDLIISDYRLAGDATGIDAIESLRRVFGSSVPAFLISGDTAPDRLREASASDCPLLHKPVAAMALRAMVNQLLTASRANDRRKTTDRSVGSPSAPRKGPAPPRR